MLLVTPWSPRSSPPALSARCQIGSSCSGAGLLPMPWMNVTCATRRFPLAADECCGRRLVPGFERCAFGQIGDALDRARGEPLQALLHRQPNFPSQCIEPVEPALEELVLARRLGELPI